jgi:hypothetical protein
MPAGRSAAPLPIPNVWGGVGPLSQESQLFEWQLGPPPALPGPPPVPQPNPAPDPQPNPPPVPQPNSPPAPQPNPLPETDSMLMLNKDNEHCNQLGFQLSTYGMDKVWISASIHL